ncbi:hypothetical protein FRC02_008236 [Tulasnella sp. 418]|nr:hypothetical protein FRC02_008236 [Tulasnella sp. 418]
MSNPPTRADRQKCYAARDAYFTCLDRLGVIAPGDEGSKCAKELKEFEAFCAKSWIDHFGKRRISDAQRAAMLAADRARR